MFLRAVAALPECLRPHFRKPAVGRGSLRAGADRPRRRGSLTSPRARRAPRLASGAARDRAVEGAVEPARG
eukprot:6067974-Prymnesium_polylepis.1